MRRIEVILFFFIGLICFSLSFFKEAFSHGFISHSHMRADIETAHEQIHQNNTPITIAELEPLFKAYFTETSNISAWDSCYIWTVTTSGDPARIAIPCIPCNSITPPVSNCGWDKDWTKEGNAIIR